MDKPKQLSIATLRAMAKQGIGHGALAEVVKNLKKKKTKKTNKKSAK
jgi:hypothetical protein